MEDVGYARVAVVNPGVYCGAGEEVGVLDEGDGGDGSAVPVVILVINITVVAVAAVSLCCCSRFGAGV